MPVRKLPTEALAYFSALGKRHGASGGKKAAQNRTATERKARATKASLAASAARKRKKKAKKAP